MMQDAYKAMGAVLPTLWFDKVTIYGVTDTTDGVFADSEPSLIVEDEPAKISRKSLKPSQQSYFGTDEYDVVMYIRTGIDIPAGSTVWVTDTNGHKTKYKQTGKAYTGYVSHLEVAMIRDEKAKEVVTHGIRNN
ncbi:hypothetical protein [Lentilactobacillus sp. Marseille-Q4993]|uniref:hypothetical protein n=1 Tax=Lentilactobacillus sp. Marseille-Q4993 TaxID=3039492 RepID=UPI0024BD554A|nr:hypothetical protein [Lentilactobacillus sp. Marseille-Q4993]